jgi:uncharacterized repeat protein (TIGR02543 family)
MALELEGKKYVKVKKGGVTYNVINVRAVKNGVTYNVWGSGSSVTYVVDNGVACSEDVLNGDSVLSPKTFTPSKSGYTFVGWRTDKTASSSVLTSKTMGTEPITLYAVFKRTLTLSYNGNGSTSGSTSSQRDTQYYNNGNTTNPTFTLASNGFSKSGFSFVQWHQGSASGTAYKAGASVALAESTTFYAEWFDNEITVFSATFNENIGSMTFTEASRNMDSNYLSSVMSKLSCGAGQDETEIREATILALTSKAKNEYKYVTITFRTLLSVYYGNVKGTACGETLYNSGQISGFYTYTKKVAIGNTNWKAVLESYNGSSSYGCDNHLAVQSIVLSIS